MAPKSKVSGLYYRIKLQVHNLRVSLTENRILRQMVQEKPNTIIFYSNGCTYQNRSCVMSNALLLTAINHNIIIKQKFLEVGHTQMEAFIPLLNGLLKTKTSIFLVIDHLVSELNCSNFPKL